MNSLQYLSEGFYVLNQFAYHKLKMQHSTSSIDIHFHEKFHCNILLPLPVQKKKHIYTRKSQANTIDPHTSIDPSLNMVLFIDAVQDFIDIFQNKFSLTSREADEQEEEEKGTMYKMSSVFLFVCLK